MRLAKIEFPIAPAIESVLLRIQVNTQTGHTQLIDLGRRIISDNIEKTEDDEK